MPSEIHGILFDKTKYTEAEAKKYLKEHNMKPIKRVHITEKFFRYRLVDPKVFKYFRIKKIGGGVEYILGFK